MLGLRNERLQIVSRSRYYQNYKAKNNYGSFSNEERWYIFWFSIILDVCVKENVEHVVASPVLQENTTTLTTAAKTTTTTKPTTTTTQDADGQLHKTILQVTQNILIHVFLTFLAIVL